MKSILSGIEYCHNEQNICHRNLNPEKVLFKRPDSDTEIKVSQLLYCCWSWWLLWRDGGGGANGGGGGSGYGGSDEGVGGG